VHAWRALWPTDDEDVRMTFITAEGVSLELGTSVLGQKSGMVELTGRGRCLTISSALWIQYRNVTDDGGGRKRRWWAGGRWLGRRRATRRTSAGCRRRWWTTYDDGERRRLQRRTTATTGSKQRRGRRRRTTWNSH